MHNIIFKEKVILLAHIDSRYKVLKFGLNYMGCSAVDDDGDKLLSVN